MLLKPADVERRKMCQKLDNDRRAVGEDRTTRVIEFDGWSRSGPHIRQDELTKDDRQLRIVA